MKKLILFSFFLMIFMLACDDTSNGNSQEDIKQDSTQVAEEEPESVSLIIGRWELVEKRIPDIGSIPLGNIFYTFDAEGKVLSEHKDDSGLGQESGPYSLTENRLVFNETAYEIVSLAGDTLRLQSNTDGISENSLLIRR